MKPGLQFLTLLLAGAALFATPAEAIPMFQGDTIFVTFPPPGGNANLAADVTITLTSLTGTTATFDIDIHNGTSILLDPGARITAFGFALSPTPTANANIAVIDSGGLSDVDAFIQGATPDNIPSLNSENVCFWVGQNCSGGGGSTELADGNRDLFSFSLAGSFGSSVDISHIGIKWQSCVGCSFEVEGNTNHRIPEPASLVLLGTGLIAIALGGWRTREKSK